MTLILENLTFTKLKNKINFIPDYKYCQKEVDSKFNEMFKGKNGILSQIKETIKKYFKDDIIPSDLVQKYYNGEPLFEIPLEDDNFIANPDCIIEDDNKNEFFILELELGDYDETAASNSHIFKAMLNAHLYQKYSGKSCSGIKIVYNGRKSFNYAFNSIYITELEKIYNEIVQIIENDTIPVFKEISKCSTCEYYDYCQKINQKDIEIEQIEDNSDSVKEVDTTIIKIQYC